MVKSADEKRIKILEAAKRRFSHYGMAKTTMAEIAKDLSFSKALLYYYFPDKNRLYAAVVTYISEEFYEEFGDEFSKITDLEAALLELLNLRIKFIKQYFYIIEFAFVHIKELPEELNAVIVKSHEEYFAHIIAVFKRAVDSGQVIDEDPEECAKLFFYATMGMRMIAMKDLDSQFIPEKEEFDAILEMQHKLARIFVRGLKK